MIKLKVLFVLLFSLWGATSGFAQNTKLKFNKDGKFKIVHFTDVHLNMVIRLQMLLSNASMKCWIPSIPIWLYLPAMLFMLLLQTVACIKY